MPLLHPRLSSTSTASSFSYRLAAASVAKHTPPRTPKAGQDFWNFTSSSADPSQTYLRSRKQDSGEDAFFVTTVGGSQHHVAFGVADGVGGWQDQGVDPSDFSQGLCAVMATTAHAYEGIAADSGHAIRPQALLQTAYDAVMADSRIMAGGSTASLAVVDPTGAMETANLGDSGYLVLGPGKVAHRSQIQTHAFNTPYQLSKIPGRMQAQHAIFGGATYFSEVPAQADVESYQLKHGDLVIFATDGVWDNLSAQDTLEIISRTMEERGYWFESSDGSGAERLLNEDLVRAIPSTLDHTTDKTYLPGILAMSLMREAKLAGLDRRRDGPFAKEVKMRYPQEGWSGGKPDDIAVVICVAVQEQAGPEDSPSPIKAKL